MPSIKDVAAKAGVSVATVSHVVNGTRTVRPETAQRVRAAIEKLNYTINAAARLLAMGKSTMFGLMISDIRNPFFPEVTTAFQDRAIEAKRDVMVFHTNYDPERTRAAMQRLISLQVSGVAILTSQIDPSVETTLREKKINAVYLDLGKPGPHVANIIVDYEHGIAQAMEHLRQLGHKDIAYIGGPMALPSAERRKKAFLKHGTRAVDADFTFQGGYFACSRLLSGTKPTAIVCGNDLMAIGAMHCVQDRGLVVPKDISITGFDDIEFAQYTQPALTTVVMPRRQIGEAAFEALEQMDEGLEIRLDTSLVVRGSTGAAR